jgi:integrase
MPVRDKGYSMATVRKRSWLSDGESKTAWVADYFDQNGKRHLKTFPTKKAADAWLVRARHEVARGVHTAENESITVGEAATLWLERGRLEGLERSTLRQYGNHVDLHIRPLIGKVKLARLSTPAIEQFRDDMLGRASWPMARKVLSSLKSILNEAQRRGLVAQNAARVVKVDIRKREKRKLAVGRGIPTKAEIQAILAAVTGRWRPLMLTAVFTGMRSSELRGLSWEHVDFDRKVIHVCQRADQWGMIGAPKSGAGDREIPMSPMVVNALREWRLECPRLKSDSDEGRLWFVFPNGDGKPENHTNIVNRGLGPLLLKVGITKSHHSRKDGDGRPMQTPKYGMHAFRHFFASWAIEQGFSPKRLQALLGHASIQMTFDIYGHLFPSPEEDHAKFAAGELSIAM